MHTAHAPVTNTSVSMQAFNSRSTTPQRNETMFEQVEAPEMAGGGVSGDQCGAGTLVLDRLHSVSVVRSRHAHPTARQRLLQRQAQ